LYEYEIKSLNVDPIKISKEMPFPIPFSVICSPSHMARVVPVVMERIHTKKNIKSAFGTTGPNSVAGIDTRYFAVKSAWTMQINIVP